MTTIPIRRLVPKATLRGVLAGLPDVFRQAAR
jgi:hypothetical protein